MQQRRFIDTQQWRVLLPSGFPTCQCKECKDAGTDECLNKLPVTAAETSGDTLHYCLTPGRFNSTRIPVTYILVDSKPAKAQFTDGKRTWSLALKPTKDDYYRKDLQLHYMTLQMHPHHSGHGEFVARTTALEGPTAGNQISGAHRDPRHSASSLRAFWTVVGLQTAAFQN